MSYQEFLAGKVPLAQRAGFDVALEEISDRLKPHARALVQWGVAGGRRAYFARFGLAKTSIQLETGRLILQRAGGRGLIVLPLGVRQEFRRDAVDLLGWGEAPRFIRSLEEADETGLYLANYETVRDGKLDPNEFTFASLDEASVLRSYGSKTYQTFLTLFDRVPYRFVATATPDPNRFKELIHYAGFLGVMDTGQALTRFFQRDPSKAGNLTLYPHKEREFWLWVSSWAVFLQKPSDLGFSDEGYELPPLRVRYHEVQVDLSTAAVDRDGQGKLLRDAAIGVQDAAREKRQSLPARIAKVTELVTADPEDHFLIWHDLEDERRSLEQAIPELTTVYGTQDLDEREQAVIDFSDGRIQRLGAKPVMLGAGTNLQRHCHRAVFAGVGFKFNDFIQAIHRLYRFLQQHEVTIDIVYAETEREVLRELQRKWTRYEERAEKMSALIREFGLNQLSMAASLTRTIGVERRETSGKGWRIVNNDCVDEARRLGADSIDLIVTSIPFSNHYEYTPSYNDFGHTDGDEHFFAQMDFLSPELLRVLKPGRLACVHVKDRILFGSATGFGTPTVNPFHAKCIAHYQRHGFAYMGMIFVDTDVVRENNQTYRLGWTENGKDSSKMGVGSPEFVLLLRKLPTDRTRAYADEPVTKTKPLCADEDGNIGAWNPAGLPVVGSGYSRARWQIDAHARWRSSGDRLLTTDELAALPPDRLGRVFAEQSLAEIYDYAAHVRIAEELEGRHALPTTFACVTPGSARDDVWTDVARMLTLNGEQSRRGLEQHVCLARGSLILTRNGYKPIQEVAIGDLVLTHKGRWRPVVAVQNTGVRPVVKVNAQGITDLTLTPDHKIWTRAVRDLPWARAHSKKEATRAEPGWMPAQGAAGSYVNFKLPPVEPAAIADTQYWWVVGRWLADGHIEVRGGATISCGRHEVADLVRMLGSFGGNPPRDTGTAIQILLRDRGRKLRKILDACGRGAAGKHLPSEAYSLPTEQARALLDGYLSGDGHYLAARHRWTASSVSKQLLLGVAILAQRAYGAVASIYRGPLGGPDTIQGRAVMTKPVWILCFDLPTERYRGRPFILDDGAWKKVRSVEPTGEVETWNLRVHEDESYTAENCVVKNCPLQFDIVDRLIERFSNPGELVMDPFAGLATVPYRALKLKRQGLGIELNSQYFRDGVRYMQVMEGETAMPSLLDLLDATPMPPTREAAE